MVLLSREMNHRGWLERWQTDLYYTLARIVPGTNVIAFVAAAGYAVRGWRGCLAAILALSLPASAIVVLLTLAYQHARDTAFGGAFINACMAAIVGIIVAAGTLLATPRFRSGERVRTSFLVGLAVVLSFWIPPLTVMVLTAVIGFFWPEPA